MRLDLCVIRTTRNGKNGTKIWVRVLCGIFRGIISELVTRNSPVGFNIAKVDMDRCPKGVKRVDTLGNEPRFDRRGVKRL